MRILVVEDDAVSNLVLSTFLKKVGEVESVEDGEAALATFRAALEEGRPFELVCLDIMLPKMDGQTVLKAIRTLETERAVPHERTTKVIMTTAMSNKSNFIQAIPRCDAYLTKPIDKSGLMFYLKQFGFLNKVGGPGSDQKKREEHSNDPQEDVPRVD